MINWILAYLTLGSVVAALMYRMGMLGDENSRTVPVWEILVVVLCWPLGIWSGLLILEVPKYVELETRRREKADKRAIPSEVVPVD